MSTTTGNCLISYDIDKNHTIVKKAMLDLGYMDSLQLTGSNRTYHLPNTTLRKKTSTDTALSDLKGVCRNTSTTLEKVITVLATDWVGI